MIRKGKERKEACEKANIQIPVGTIEEIE